MRFRKKPVIIEATQWFKNGDHPEDDVARPLDIAGRIPPREGNVVRYFRRPDVSGDNICQQCFRRMQEHGWIDTLEGGHIVCVGDWIITGIKGERYPCKPDIFEATYEAVNGNTGPDFCDLWQRLAMAAMRVSSYRTHPREYCDDTMKYESELDYQKAMDEESSLSKQLGLTQNPP